MDLTAPRPWWPLGDTDQLRDALRSWISTNWDTSISVGDWWERLASAGLAAPTWNCSHGGLGATAQAQRIIEEELAAAGTIAPPLAGAGVRLVGPILRQFATVQQTAELLPTMLTGQHLWTLLLNEPGSDEPKDTACTATFDWKYVTVDGVKSCEHDGATRAVVLTRSAELQGHKGLTCLLFDLTSEGITTHDGLGRFDGARVTHDRVLGDRDSGWAVVKTILPYLQRSLAGRIQRGLVDIKPGSVAGNLDRTVADVLASHRLSQAPMVERRVR